MAEKAPERPTATPGSQEWTPATLALGSGVHRPGAKVARNGGRPPATLLLVDADGNAERVLLELLESWDEDEDAFFGGPIVDVPRRTSSQLTSLGAELGERLVSEILDGVKAGRQGASISEPERLRTAIFVRGLSLGDFARRAELAPSTLSRALAGRSITVSSWRSVITTLRRL